ncbi:hypothetical protein FB451DRAFT_1391018 [Mycena latifolia]|nr:hypothetical protein FB451DRAFT_1391018 [Mycena latifolia]
MSGLASSLPWKQVLIAFKSGEPAHITNTAQAQVWRGMLEYLDTTSHVFIGVLVNLLQPGAIAHQPRHHAPATDSIPFAGMQPTATHSLAAMRPPLRCPRLSLIIRGFRQGHYTLHYTFTLTKLASGNPWRMSAMSAQMAFTSGKADVTKNPETNVAWL